MDFQRKFVLTSIIGTTNQYFESSHFARLTRFYDVSGLDPNTNRLDIDVTGGILDFYHNYQKYEMIEMELPREDTTKYKDKETVYISPRLLIKPGDRIKITAKTYSDDSLSAETRIPKSPVIEYSYPFNHGITTKINRFMWGDSWIISWYKNEDIIYHPKLILFYSKEINDSTTQSNSIEIPTEYLNIEGRVIPLFPGYTLDNSVEYKFDAIDRTMEIISEGEPDKSKIAIIYILFDFMEFDRHLSKYFSSTNGYLDSYSIRIDESVYTNVSGGVGIVGSYLHSSYIWNLDRAYVADFGYKYNR